MSLLSEIRENKYGQWMSFLGLFINVTPATTCFMLGTYSTELKDVLAKVLEKNPAERSSIGDLLNHPYLSTAKQQRQEKHGEELTNSMRQAIDSSKLDLSKAFSPMNRTRAIIKNAGEFLGRRRTSFQHLRNSIRNIVFSPTKGKHN